ncbi:MAG: hypothetical protein RBT81_11830, partial [Gammaproteobacteria bacterium]|nr:hypothetical protein [Gammaproteobacteria bacterium]
TIHWPSGLSETHTDVPAGAVYRATEGDGIAIASAEGAAPYPCAWEPPIDPAHDRGIFIVRNCVTGVWQLHAVDGGSPSTISYRGSVHASAPFTSVTPRSIEIYDEIVLAPDRIDFTLNVRNGSRDAVDFMIADDASICISIDAPADAIVRYGPLARLVPRRFDPLTMQACGSGPPTPDPEPEPGPPPPPVRESCGMPAYDAGRDDGIFLWRNCGTGEWHARLTAGGGPQRGHGGGVNGSAVSGVTSIALEADDVLRTVGPTRLEFRMIVAGANVDGFRFMPAESSRACFDVDTASIVRVGAAGRMIATPFRLDTLGPCAP